MLHILLTLCVSSKIQSTVEAPNPDTNDIHVHIENINGENEKRKASDYSNDKAHGDYSNDEVQGGIVSNCPPGSWRHFQGYCYKPMKAAKTWENAETACISEGAHLASIHSKEENEFVVSLMGAVENENNFWLGGTA